MAKKKTPAAPSIPDLSEFASLAGGRASALRLESTLRALPAHAPETEALFERGAASARSLFWNSACLFDEDARIPDPIPGAKSRRPRDRRAADLWAERFSAFDDGPDVWMLDAPGPEDWHLPFLSPSANEMVSSFYLDRARKPRPSGRG